MLCRLSVILSIVLMVCLTPSAGQQCDREGLKRFDELTSKATVYGNANLKFPETSKELLPWCRQANKYLTEVESFNKKCNKDLFKQVYGVFIYSYRNTLKQYCKVNSKTTDTFLASTPCYNKNRKAEVKCYTNWMDKILGAQNTDDKMKIPHLCCAYTDYLECTKETVPKEKGCDDKKVDTMNSFIRSYTDNVLNFICGDYTGENDKCSQLGEPPKKKKSQRRSKSVSLPIADLLVSFKEI